MLGVLLDAARTRTYVPVWHRVISGFIVAKLALVSRGLVRLRVEMSVSL